MKKLILALSLSLLSLTSCDIEHCLDSDKPKLVFAIDSIKVYEYSYKGAIVFVTNKGNIAVRY